MSQRLQRVKSSKVTISWITSRTTMKTAGGSFYLTAEAAFPYLTPC